MIIETRFWLRVGEWLQDFGPLMFWTVLGVLGLLWAVVATARGMASAVRALL